VRWLEACTGLRLVRTPLLGSGALTQVRAFRQASGRACLLACLLAC
jgi:hypothetical protein